MNAIERLYKTTLQPWNEQRRFRNKDTSLSEYCISSLKLDELHQPDAPQLLEKIAKLCEQSFSAGVGQIQQTASTLKFDCMSDQSLPHPIKWNQQHGFEESSDVQWGLTHGAVGLDTILANRQGESWLIDFAQVGSAPLLIDFVALETAVKFQHLSTKNLTIRCHLEEALNKMKRLNAATQSAALTPEGNTTLKTIQKIRTLASEITGANLATYQQALFYYSLAHLQQYDPTKQVQRRTLTSFIHALLSAALIAQKIQATENGDAPPDAKAGGLWIDSQEKEVWVEGRQITTLTPQDYQILDMVQK
ncbi:MAG: hypothetical protein GY770_20755 [Aestuariibacter sp.]|nr:hypothetical protein [Aestuariibacter sp.]